MIMIPNLLALRLASASLPEMRGSEVFSEYDASSRGLRVMREDVRRFGCGVCDRSAAKENIECTKGHATAAQYE